jgi:uncharacterized protein YuzE
LGRANWGTGLENCGIIEKLKALAAFMQIDKPITAALPELIQVVLSALITIGRSELAEQLAKVSIRSATYDATVDAGYIYLTESRPLNICEQNTINVRHRECVSLDSLPGMVVIDVDNLGRLMGIELLGHADVFRRLGIAK